MLAELVEVRCTASSPHQAARYALDTTTLTQTEVNQGSYTISGSLSGESYAAQYSLDTGKQHTLVSSQPVQVSVTLTYQDGAWTVASEKPVVSFDTLCQPDTSPSVTPPSDTSPSGTSSSDTSPSDTSPSGTAPVPTSADSTETPPATGGTDVTEPSDTAATSASVTTAAATTTPTSYESNDTPKTGDPSSPALAVVALALSGVGLAVLLVSRRRTRHGS